MPQRGVPSEDHRGGTWSFARAFWAKTSEELGQWPRFLRPVVGCQISALGKVRTRTQSVLWRTSSVPSRQRPHAILSVAKDAASVLIVRGPRRPRTRRCLASNGPPAACRQHRQRPRANAKLFCGLVKRTPNLFGTFVLQSRQRQKAINTCKCNYFANASDRQMQVAFGPKGVPRAARQDRSPRDVDGVTPCRQCRALVGVSSSSGSQDTHLGVERRLPEPLLPSALWP